MGLPLSIVFHALLLSLALGASANTSGTWEIHSHEGFSPGNEIDYNKNSTRQMQSLVSVEGKSYYVADARSNWHDAEEYCEANGMELATIESRLQWECLKDALRDRKEWWIFWTAGRDSRELSIFLWAESGPQVSPTVVQEYSSKFVAGEPHHYCLSLYNIPQGSSTTGYGVYSILCSQEHNIMCQKRALQDQHNII